MEFTEKDLKLMTVLMITMDHATKDAEFKKAAEKENTFEAGFAFAIGVVGAIGIEIAMSAIKDALGDDKPKPTNQDMH